MIEIMNGHHITAPSPPLPLPESLRQRPALALLLSAALGALGARCSPEMVAPLQEAVRRLEGCPPVRTVEAKPCSPPCPQDQVCSDGTCVKVASDRAMLQASQPDNVTRVILEIRATTR